MTTHMRLRLGAVALVLIVVLLLGGSHLCGVALNRTAADPGMRPIGDGALACTEFWLNRYQTLIGTLIALSAALLALYPARGQLTEARRQSALGASQAAASIAREIEEEIKIYTTAIDIYNKVEYMMIDYDLGTEFESNRENIESIRSIIGEIHKVHAAVNRNYMRYLESDEANIFRLEFMKSATGLAKSLDGFLSSFDITFSDIDSVDPRTPTQITDDCKIEVEDCNEIFNEYRYQLILNLRSTMENIWIDTRKFESEAFER